MESRERRAMAPQYHPAGRGRHGGRLLLGGSATPQQPQPPWHSRQAVRYYDSDDDSGIGHSNGGQGDRVGSTSSTETEVPADFSTAQLSPGNLQKWWSAGSGKQQVCPGLPVDPWLTQQRVHPTASLTLNSRFCPPAVSTPEGSECADDVFHPSKATMVRLPGPAVRDHRHPSNLGWKRRSPAEKTIERHNNGPMFMREPFVDADEFQALNGPVVHINLPESRLKSPKGTLQKCKSFNHNSGPAQSERRSLGDGRRVWSYCGDGNFPNFCENVKRTDKLRDFSKDFLLDRTRPLAQNRLNDAPSWQKPTRVFPWRDHDVAYLNQEALAHHYDVPVSLRSALLENGRLNGAKSVSLSSLITENELLRVHAFPASVIPASELGDTLSESCYVQHNALNTNNRYFQDYTLDLNRKYVQQPPPPPPPPLIGVPRPRQLAISNGGLKTPNFYAESPPVQSVKQSMRDNGFKDIAVKEPSTPMCTTGEAAYATVIKPKRRMNAGQKVASFNCSPASAFLDEIEPPLPPRNYRRDLASSKHLTTSKTSLTDKMQGFSRTAKQALRQAFSLEGLNCVSDSAHNDSEEWDNESDWGRIINPKPRTPAAVKARDANRQKLKRSNSAKHPITMATLC